MDTDLYLVIGMTLGFLAIPSLLNAYTEGRAPRLGAIMVLVGGVLVAIAVSRTPGGYEFAELPQVFFRVIGRYMN